MRTTLGILLVVMMSGCSNKFVTQAQYDQLIKDLNYKFGQHGAAINLLAKNQKDAGILKEEKKEK